MAIVLPKFSRRRSPAGASVQTQPAVNVSLCREDGRYEAGGMLSAKWRVSRVPIDRLQGLEVSVLWHTEGKGDEDLHVHHFHRLNETQLRQLGLVDEQSISCQLPVTPLSYHGKLITIRWCLRLRLFMVGGREIMAEQPFYVVASAPRRLVVDQHQSLTRGRGLENVVSWSAVTGATVHAGSKAEGTATEGGAFTSNSIPLKPIVSRVASSGGADVSASPSTAS